MTTANDAASNTQEQRLKLCPHCTEKYGMTGAEVYWLIGEDVMNPLSRRDNTYICKACGVAEALADWLDLSDMAARIVVETNRQEAMRLPEGLTWGTSNWPTGGYHDWIAQARQLGRLTSDGWAEDPKRNYARHWPAKDTIDVPYRYFVGKQVLYIPPHAEGDLNHRDVQAGFIVGAASDGDLWCRYWRYRNHRPGKSILRTKANSERTSRDLLRYARTRPQPIVVRACRSLGYTYGDEIEL